MIFTFLMLDAVLAAAYVGNVLVGAPSRKFTLLLHPGVPGDLPDWWAGSQLFLASALAAVVVTSRPLAGRRRGLAWLLPVVLVLLSLDRVTGLLGWLAAHAPEFLGIAERAAGGASFLVLTGLVHAIPLIAVGLAVVLLWPALAAVPGLPARYVAAGFGLSLASGAAAWLGDGTAAGLVELVLVTGSGTLFLWATWDLFESRPEATAPDRPVAGHPEHGACYCRGYLGFHLTAVVLLFAAVFLPRSAAWRFEGGVAVDGTSLGAGRIAAGDGPPADGVSIRDLGPSAHQTSLGLDTSPDEVVGGEVIKSHLRRRSVRYLTDGVLRWSVDVDSVPELGGNSGSIFGINRYSDDGTHLGTEFVILRENGNVGIGARGRSVVVGGGELFEAPPNALPVSGNVAVGGAAARTLTAPPDGMLVEGNVVLGAVDPVARLTVDGGIHSTGPMAAGGFRLLAPADPSAPDARPDTAAEVLAGLRPVELPGKGRVGLISRDPGAEEDAIEIGELVAALTVVVDQQRRAIEDLQRSLRELRAGAGD